MQTSMGNSFSTESAVWFGLMGMTGLLEGLKDLLRLLLTVVGLKTGFGLVIWTIRILQLLMILPRSIRRPLTTLILSKMVYPNV